MTKPISSKQEQFLRAEHKRINLLSGSVRSGKTYISLIAWALFVGSMPANCEFIMVGKTITALKRNCLNLLVDLVGSNNFKYSLSQKSASLFGRRVWLEGANDERSESKIRGMTLSGAYCDELTLFPRGFYMMLLSRLSVRGAQLYATTNPDSPNHWVKTDIIDNEDIQPQLDHWHFTLDDNEYNDPQYVIDLKSAYKGVFHQRYILGLWVLAEGLVYPNFDPERHIADILHPEGVGDWWISLDYGIVNPFAAGLWHVVGNVAYCADEYYYDGKDNRQRTDEEHYAAIKRLAGDRLIQHIVVDPSASSFKETIKRHGRYNVRNAENDVIPGIANCMTLLDTEYVKFSPKCKGLIKEFSLYSWDVDSGKDEVIKENDHAMDGIFRYFVRTILRKEFKHISWGANGGE